MAVFKGCWQDQQGPGRRLRLLQLTNQWACAASDKHGEFADPTPKKKAHHEEGGSK
jgi:hypothetical protein